MTPRYQLNTADLPFDPTGARYVAPANHNPNPIPRARGRGDIIGNQAGGVPFLGAVVGRPGWNNSIENANPAVSNTNDALIERLKGGWWHNPYYMPPATGSGNISWTAAGPAPSMLNMKRITYRRLVGGSKSYMEGLHTNIPHQPRDLNGKTAMRPGRQNQLTVQTYRGQSFSSQTQVLTRLR